MLDITFVRSLTPKRAHDFAAYLGADRVIVADPGIQKALKRARTRLDWTADAIRRWYTS